MKEIIKLIQPFFKACQSTCAAFFGVQSKKIGNLIFKVTPIFLITLLEDFYCISHGCSTTAHYPTASQH